MKSVRVREASRLLCRYSAAPRPAIAIPASTYAAAEFVPRRHSARQFHVSVRRDVVKPYMLADIGEGITECQVIQWFVKPGARVEQFDPICEVQSDKASVEITSRFDGVIKKLYYEPDDMAKVGKPLVDIDIQSEISAADEALLSDGPEGTNTSPGTEEETPSPSTQPPEEFKVDRNDTSTVQGDIPPPVPSQTLPPKQEPSQEQSQSQRRPGKNHGTYASLAVPAVRHLVKELKLTIEDIEGTGKDGRVTKEDVQNHFNASKQASATTTQSASAPSPGSIQQVEDHVHKLTPVQAGMFKQMTKSLSIPHFLYTESIDFLNLNAMRTKFNAGKDKGQRISALPFILKATSMALQQYPLLNAHLDTNNGDKPQLVVKGSHNIGIAVDSPAGLLVPVIKNVQSHSIETLAAEIQRISKLARDGKLTNADLSGATFTLSNIGSIGGGAVAPVIVSPQVAIVGVGKAKSVPAFGENGEIIRKEECVFSWSADHRVIDGAYAARCAEAVRGYLENVESMLIRLR